MTKLIVACRKFEKAQKKHILEAGIFTLLRLRLRVHSQCWIGQNVLF